ncbi:hypothetical protein NHX12_017774 [Muraenolepis orangiensis]|uniref:E3 ubiquitin-protein ligase Topors n=1 Tax=Muraenolepis orangiensis TaxID=630683 RepID=A0A9Q0IX01_9TELE|nr:hypothetical protein NHX12_017774 [Muraenolepis orangiensis]
MSGYTPDERLRVEQITKLRRQWLKDQELSPREPVLKPQAQGPIARFWTGFLEPKSLWRLYTHKAYRGGVFALTRVLIPAWIIHYCVKYHMANKPYGIVALKPQLFPMMSASKIKLRPHPKHGTHNVSGDTSSEVSPDSKCPICLDSFHNMSYLELCLHKFCFRCIREWSKNKAECPLCKQPFNSIYHSIKSDQDFKKYDLRPTDNGSFGSFGGVRFRYHTTMTGARQRAERRNATPPYNGVMPENQGDTQLLHERKLRRTVSRLAARRRAASEGRAVRAMREEEMITFRRGLYRQGVRVQSVEDGGRSRDTTAGFYRRNPACLHRLVPWLRRELMVLYQARVSLVNILQELVMSRITSLDLEDSVILEELRPFLEGRTEHFFHEFISFAKSPFNMEAYDLHAVYDYPDTLFNDDDSSSRSSVIAISEDDQMSVDLDTLGESMSSGTLSQSAWDDETPGPSYFIERSNAQPLSIPDSDSSQEEEQHKCKPLSHPNSPLNPTDATRSVLKKDGSLDGSSLDVGDVDDEDDCVIVGFVKPITQLTPELVQLSSDSEESVHVEMDMKCHPPQHIPCSPSTSPVPAEEICHPPASSRRGHSTSKEQSSLSRSRRHNLSERKSDYDKYSKRRRSVDRCRERRRSRSGNRVKNRRDRRSRTASDSSRSSMSGRRSRSTSRECSRSKRDNKEKRQDSAHELPRSYQGQSYSHYGRDRDDGWIRYSKKTIDYPRGRRSCESRSQSRSREPSHKGRREHSHWDSSPSGTYSAGSRSPSSKKRSGHDKPGGKRKYKTRHLEEPDTNVDLRPESEATDTTSCKSGAEKQKTSKEKSAKRDASPEVETDHAGNWSDGGRRHHHHHYKKNKKHKKSRKHRNKERTGKRSPVVTTVIIIESDSCHSTYSNVDLSGEGDLASTAAMPPDTDATDPVDGVSKSDSLPADVFN